MSLYVHQEQGIDRLRGGKLALFWEMGLGKTRAVLEAFRQRQHAGLSQRMLVICPAIAKNVWVKEARELGMAPPLVINGKANPPGITALPGPILVVNYDILEAHATWLSEWLQGGVLVLDESHQLRNCRTKRYRAVQKIVAWAGPVWLLTGTPMVNSSLDLYHQLRLLGPRAFPMYWWSAGKFGGTYSNSSYNSFKRGMEYHGVQHEDVLMRHLQPVVDRRLKADCLDLPEKFRNVQWLARNEKYGIKGRDLTTAVATARQQLARVKAHLTLDYIEEVEERPLVVFGYHREFLDYLGKHLGAYIIDGSTSAAQRNRYVDAFQEGRIPILLCQLQAAGVGITLTAAHHAVFGELHWSAVDHRQAEDRLHRPGQEREVTYHYLMVEHSIDELVWNHVLNKGNAIDRLDTAGKITDLQPFMEAN